MLLNYIIFIFATSSLATSEILNCGQPKRSIEIESLKILETTPGQWPWVASLIQHQSNKYTCGATLISSNHLLTAANCFQRKTFNLTADNFYVLLGRHNISSSANEPNSVTRTISKVFIHESYNSSYQSYKSDYDIAIIKLNESVPFNDFIMPACLPNEPSINDGIIVGYGHNMMNNMNLNTSNFVRVNFLDKESCIYIQPSFIRLVSRRSFCGGNVTELQCLGDPGAGFFSIDKTTERYTVYGIISQTLNPRNCKTGNYIVLADLRDYTNWINDILTNDIDPCESMSCGDHSVCEVDDNNIGKCQCVAGYEDDKKGGCRSKTLPTMNPCLLNPSVCEPNFDCDFDSITNKIQCSCTYDVLRQKPPYCLAKE